MMEDLDETRKNDKIYSRQEFDDFRMRFITNNFVLSAEDAKHLYEFMNSVGYISHEFHEPIHDLIRRLRQFVHE